MNGIVLGIDGGGTYTRVAAADLTGRILAVSKRAGSHPGKNETPAENVQSAIQEVLEQSSASKESVRFITAGFAGLNKPSDRQWAEMLLGNKELQCPVEIMNDAQLAQYGAFTGQCGIAAIAGTGSAVVGKTETGRVIKDADFFRDTEAASRYLSLHIIYELISRNYSGEDEEMANAIFSYWRVNSREELAAASLSSQEISVIQKLSRMAPIVTEAAEQGNEMARRACEKAVQSLIISIRLVGSAFALETVPLTFVGGVANQPYIQKSIQRSLTESGYLKSFRITKADALPVIGAILNGYEKLGIHPDQETLEKLRTAGDAHNLYT